ncbi:MAG: hypothetical protein H6581_23700 [Bacteroidia bacterium]|nr:hypothetical protein [Bacteroidia bacterium]
MENDYLDKIDKYLDDQMTVAEKHNFEAEVEGNFDLKKSLEAEQELRNVVWGGAEESLRQKLTKIHQEGPPSKRGFRIVWLAPALAAAVVILVIWFSPSLGGKKDPSFYANKYFKPYEDLISNLGQDTSQLTQALAAYNSENYTLALATFPEIPPTDSLVFTLVAIYKANAYFQLNQSEKAIETLQSMRGGAFSDLREEVDWYLALSFLLAGETEKAIPLLESLVKGVNYNDEARELIEKLN